MLNNRKINTEFHNKIVNEYINPFIIAIKESALEEKSVIQETFKYFQEYFEFDQKNKLLARYGLTNPISPFNYLSNIESLNLSKAFKAKLSSIQNFKKLFINLGSLYLDNEIQQKNFKNLNSIEIQTFIREFIHDYINPLTFLKINLNKATVIPKNDGQFNLSSLLNLPDELKFSIMSYLDYKSIVSFGQTCKSTYFFKKNVQSKLLNVFYTIGNDVCISRQRTFSGATDSSPILLKEKISDENIITSFLELNKNKIPIFTSVYQAIEYAHSKQHGGFDGNEGFIPSILAVVYAGDSSILKYQTEIIELNSGILSNNKHSSSVTYAVVVKTSIFPVLGTVVFNDEDFASYRVFNVVNFEKYLQQNENKKSSCTIQ